MAERLEVEDVALETLSEYPGNPRRGDVDALVRSLQRFSQYRPIVVNHRTNQILAGNHTFRAARQLGWERIAVQWVDTDEAEAAAIVLADNRTSDLGAYEEHDLALMLAGVRDLDASLLEAASWAGDDLLAALAVLEPGPTTLTDADAVPEPPAEPVTKPGELWLLGDHRLLCGDASSEADHKMLLDGEVCDLVLTDPPYGVGIDYGTETEDTPEAIGALMAKTLPLLLAHGCALITSGQGLMWDYPKPTWLLGWVHPAGMGSGPWGFTCFNPVLAYGPDPYLARQLGRRADVLVLAADREGETDHPVTKPVAVWRWLMERGPPAKGETVFDPFAGSGTTVIAAHELGRRAYLMEIEPRWCDVIVRRFEDHTGERAVRA